MAVLTPAEREDVLAGAAGNDLLDVVGRIKCAALTQGWWEGAAALNDDLTNGRLLHWCPYENDAAAQTPVSELGPDETRALRTAVFAWHGGKGDAESTVLPVVAQIKAAAARAGAVAAALTPFEGLRNLWRETAPKYGALR